MLDELDLPLPAAPTIYTFDPLADPITEAVRRVDAANEAVQRAWVANASTRVLSAFIAEQTAAKTHLHRMHIEHSNLPRERTARRWGPALPPRGKATV